MGIQNVRTGGKGMSYNVYLESSIVNLKPRVLDFLHALIEKAKEVKDYAISMKQKELADLVGKDTRTVSRYLNELEESSIIQTKGRKGRAGGTVILFNTEFIKFNTSDKALVNSDNPESIDEIMEQKFPKKKVEPPKRNRRTKQQLVEAQVLQEKKSSEIAKLNAEVIKLGGIPNWEWFKKTNDPVGNYRTYLLSRLYNRYAALFTDHHNDIVLYKNGDGNEVMTVSQNYDVLEDEFYGTARWNQIEKLRKFLEENNIEAAPYLSAQFARSIFDSSRKNKKNIALPFVNALTSDTSYNVYLDYCKYQKNSSSYASWGVVPAQFANDFVVQAIINGYENAESGGGLLELRSDIEDFVYGTGSDATDDALLQFIRITDANMRKKKVSLKSRNIIKKYLVLQSLTLTGGVSKVPKYVIIGSELTRAALIAIGQNLELDKDKIRHMKQHALGQLAYPRLDRDEQIKQGIGLNYQYSVLYETSQVLKLIMERKGLHISIRELSEAFKEYGREFIPVDDYSILDVDQIVTMMQNHVEEKEIVPEITHEDIVQKKEYILTGEVGATDPLADAFLKELEGGSD